jgi:hypothetical protein
MLGVVSPNDKLACFESYFLFIVRESTLRVGHFASVTCLIS